MSEINFFTTSYEESKHELIAFRNLNREMIRDESNLDWRYQEKPSTLKPILVWAVNPNGQKVGSLVVNPHRYLIDGKICTLGMIGDISIAEKYRGQGIAKKMFHYLSEIGEFKKFTAYIVMPNETAARPLKKAGFKTVLSMERFVKIIDIREKIEGLPKRKFLSRLISSVPNLLLKSISFESLIKESDRFKSELTNKVDQRFDDLWSKVDKRGIIIGIRDREYLNWRYAQHPLYQYEIFTLENRLELVGYVVSHVENRRCVIDDFFCLRDHHIADYLMFYFLKHSRENKAISSISIRASHPDLSGWFLHKFGFFKCSDRMNFMVKLNDNQTDSPFVKNNYQWCLAAGDKEV